MTKITLDCGAEIERESFFAIMGAGRKKALDQVNKLKIGDGETLEFTLRDLSDLQAFLTELLRHNDELQGEIATLKASNAPVAKPRHRVPAGQRFTVVPRTEIWSSIPGIDAAYEVSNFGNFRNQKSGKTVSVSSTNSIAQVCLKLAGPGVHKQHRTMNAARMVALAFCPQNGNTELHFKDGKCSNIEAANLEWLPKGDARLRRCDFFSDLRGRNSHSRRRKAA